MKKNFWLKIALCLISFDLYADSVVVPLITTILKEYPNTSLFQQNFLISGAGLFAIPAALLTGVATKFMSKKRLATIGLCCYLFGGVGGVFTQSINYLLVTRAFTGIAEGILSTIALSLIAELFRDDTERGALNGMYNAVSAAFGSIASILAGIIALTSWRASFLINTIAVLSLFLLLRFVPETPVEKTSERTKVQHKEGDLKHSAIILFCLIYYFILGTMFDQVYYLIDLVVAEKGLGTSVLTGIFSSATTIDSFLASVIFGLLYAKFKKILPLVFFLGPAISLIGMALGNSILLIFLMVMLAGFTYALSMPYFATLFGRLNPKNNGNLMAIFTVEMFGGGFICPYIPRVFEMIFKISTISGTFLYSGILVAFLGISFQIVYSHNFKEKEQKQKEVVLEIAE